jgi:hypothetical protein
MVSGREDWLSEFVRGRMAAQSAADPAARAWLDEAGGITLYGTIGHDAVLRPGGSVWFYHDDNSPLGEWKWLRASRRERMGALVIASDLRPLLASVRHLTAHSLRVPAGNSDGVSPPDIDLLLQRRPAGNCPRRSMVPHHVSLVGDP